MKALTLLLPAALVSELGWTLIHFLWQGTAIALLYALCQRLLRRDGTIFPQVRNVKVYKCPADMKKFAGVPSVRSMSINCWFNPIVEPDGIDHRWTETKGKVLRKLDMTTLPPARTWTFIEENPDSINDGWCIVNVAANPRSLLWVDYPASYHDNATPLSFADGHVESKKWSDRNVLKTPFGNPRMLGDGPDLQWLSERSTVMDQ